MLSAADQSQVRQMHYVFMEVPKIVKLLEKERTMLFARG